MNRTEKRKSFLLSFLIQRKRKDNVGMCYRNFFEKGKYFDIIEECAVPTPTAPSCDYLDLLKAGCSTVGLFINPSFSIQEFNAVKSKASFVKTVLCSLSLWRGKWGAELRASSWTASLPAPQCGERQRREGPRPARRRARGRDQGHMGWGPGEGLRLVWSLTKLKPGWILLQVWILRRTTYSFASLQYTYQIIWYITHKLLKWSNVLE